MSQTAVNMALFVQLVAAHVTFAYTYIYLRNI